MKKQLKNKKRKQKNITGFQFVESNKKFIIMKQIILQNYLNIFSLILFKNLIIINVKNENSENLLHIAAENNNIDIIKLLLAKGIDVNAINKRWYYRPKYCGKK
ncbi:ankyrin repeat domain-containing protein [Spiroplasma endosymbiont of Polydrusus formosus]|uniref:ankyrin repeat domain-containing protein n=1 Tax=Spiroplasma endosymbiont of Polydrusus formosus TaxID=3139326 RepID=UPI0035B54E9C